MKKDKFLKPTLSFYLGIVSSYVRRLRNDLAFCQAIHARWWKNCNKMKNIQLQN